MRSDPMHSSLSLLTGVSILIRAMSAFSSTSLILASNVAPLFSSTWIKKKPSYPAQCRSNCLHPENLLHRLIFFMKLFVKSRARLLRILRDRIMKWTHNSPPSLCVPSRGACWQPHGRWWQWVRPLTRQTQSRWPLPPPALRISSWAEGGRNRNMFLIYDVKHQFKDINSPQLQIIANS